MSNYTYEITIAAGNEQEALTKMNAVSTLINKLTAKELEKMASILKNDPIKTALAKKYMNL